MLLTDAQLLGTQPGMAVARSAVAQIDFSVDSPHCLVSIVGVPAEVTAFNGFADVAVKALMERGDRRLSCVIRTMDGPYYVMTPFSPEGRCLDSDRPELVARDSHTIPLAARPIGNLCMRFPEWLSSDDVARQHGALVLAWDGVTGGLLLEQAD